MARIDSFKKNMLYKPKSTNKVGGRLGLGAFFRLLSELRQISISQPVSA